MTKLFQRKSCIKFGWIILNQSNKDTNDYDIINIDQKIYNLGLLSVYKKRGVTFANKSKLCSL